MDNLFKAIIKNDLHTVEELVAGGADVNLKGFQGYTPIMIAISWRDTAMIDFLYNAGANVLQRNDMNRNAMDIAREYNVPHAQQLFKGKHA